MFNYSDELFSDLYKDCYNHRPGLGAFENWDSLTPAQKQIEWDLMCRSVERQIVEQREEEAFNLEIFKTRVADIIACGAKDAREAIKWMMEGGEEYGIDGLEYSFGLRFGSINQVYPVNA